jgi:hypothetical protein
VAGCPHSARSRAGLWYHFFHRHWNDRIHILEEHPVIYPQCDRCGLHIAHSQLINRHYNSKVCQEGRERKERRAAERAAFDACAVTFQLNDELLEKVETFRYLGRLLASNNSDWPTLYYNLKKAQKRWGMVARVLVQDGASARCMGLFYKAIVQAVLLYGCETWTLTNPMICTLKSFHHRVARHISGLMPTFDGKNWTYPLLKKALEDSGLYPLRTYIQRRVNTIQHYIATRPIYQLCLIASEAARNDDRCLRWWTQSLSDDDHDDDDDDSKNDGDDDDY